MSLDYFLSPLHTGQFFGLLLLALVLGFFLVRGAMRLILASAGTLPHHAATPQPLGPNRQPRGAHP